MGWIQLVYKVNEYFLRFVSFGDKKLLSEQKIIRCILIDICLLTSLDLTSVVHKKQECLSKFNSDPWYNQLFVFVLYRIQIHWCVHKFRINIYFIRFKFQAYHWTIDKQHFRSVNSKSSVISSKSSVTSNNNKGLNDKAINTLLIYCFTPNNE